MSSFSSNALWMARNVPTYYRFRAALGYPRRAQEEFLRAVLIRNADSAYGRKYTFQNLRTVEQYQETVPVVTYEDIVPWIERIKRGDRDVLTAEPVLMMEKTSGTTSASKYVPYTRSLLQEFQRAVAAWVYDAYRHRPRLLGTTAYWSVSTTRGQETTSGGLRVGFGSDTEYLGGLDRLLLRQILQVPVEVAQIPDVEGNLYATVRFMLESPTLGLISVWSPSFLIVLFKILEDHAEELVRDISLGTLTGPSPLPSHLQAMLQRKLHPRPERARELQSILSEGRALSPPRVWPSLQLVSCWTSGASAYMVPDIHARLPGVEIQGKGLLATEGVVSIPLTGFPGAVVTVTSHFYEFVDVERPDSRPRLVDELENGKTYRVILTTGGGLYRYDLQDAVKVVGTIARTPLLEFVGKTAKVSDLCGEKLNEVWVQEVLGKVLPKFNAEGKFAMVAPEWGHPPYYVLFLEAPLSRSAFLELVHAVEHGLMESHHYAYCRAVGQLGPLRGFRITRNGAMDFLAGSVRSGQSLEGIKHCSLDKAPGWSTRFEGEFVGGTRSGDGTDHVSIPRGTRGF